MTPDLGPQAAHEHAAARVVVTPGDAPIGARVIGALEAGSVGDVVGVSRAELEGSHLKALLDGADAVVHVALEMPEALEVTRAVLDAAADCGVRTLCLVSSALVYGAWPNNPVPLTEDAPLRPNPGFPAAAALADAERLAWEWRTANPGAVVSVLRPTVALAEGEPGWLAPMLAAARSLPVGDEDPPGQFVHLDDLAAAAALAVVRRHDGPWNVAPEGWISGEELRALAGGVRVHLPDKAAEAVAELRWMAGVSEAPPGLLPWTTHPWVVASDQLRAAGWEASHTNEEAFVAGHKPSPWATVSPQRRQELALGLAAVGGAALLGGAAWFARRLLARR